MLVAISFSLKRLRLIFNNSKFWNLRPLQTVFYPSQKKNHTLDNTVQSIIYYTNWKETHTIVETSPDLQHDCCTRGSTMKCVVLVIIIILSFFTLIAVWNFQNTKLVVLFSRYLGECQPRPGTIASQKFEIVVFTYL